MPPVFACGKAGAQALEELISLARLCVAHARATQAQYDIAAELTRMAKAHEANPAQLKNVNPERK